MSHYDDDNYEDGIDERRAAARMQTHLWKRLFGYALNHKRDLWLLGGCSLVPAAVETLYPLITKGVLDDIEANGADANLWLWGFYYLVCTVALSLSVAGS